MKKILIIVILFFNLLFAQQDTIIFNPKTLNYEVYYTGDIGDEGTPKDTAMYFEFVPGNKLIPHVHAWLEKDLDLVSKSSPDNILYLYRIENDKNSPQNLDGFTVYFNNSEKNTKNLSLLKWKNFGKKDLWTWWADSWLEPSWKVAGFILENPNLPTIGISRFSGTPSDILRYPNDITPLKWDMYEKIGRLSTRQYNSVIKYTIVPGTKPKVFIPTAWADSLLSFNSRSLELGWIKKENVANQIELKLARIKTNIQKGQVSKAVKALEKFDSFLVKQANPPKYDKKMTSEVYALLKYNAEYLKEQLMSNNKIINVPR